MAKVPDPTDPRVARLAAIDWGRVMKRLTWKAQRWGLAAMDAEDLAQNAIKRFFGGGWTSWDPETDPSAYLCLLSKMENRRKTEHDTEELRQALQPTELDSEKIDQTPPESDRNAERAFLEDEAAGRNLTRLRASLADFPVTLALLELSAREGQQLPRVAAVKLGVDVKAIYTAEAQLERHARRLRQDGSDPAIQLVKAGAVAGGAR